MTQNPNSRSSSVSGPDKIYARNKDIMENHIRRNLGSLQSNYIQSAEYLQNFLSKPEAYYDEARPTIVILLETARETLARVVSLQPGQIFHISLCYSQQVWPYASAYSALVKSVRPFFDKFLEIDLKKRLMSIFASIHVSSQQTSHSGAAASASFINSSMSTTPVGTDSEPPIRVPLQQGHQTMPYNMRQQPSTSQIPQHVSTSLTSGSPALHPPSPHNQPPPHHAHSPHVEHYHPSGSTSQQRHSTQTFPKGQAVTPPVPLPDHLGASAPPQHSIQTTIHPSVARQNTHFIHSIPAAGMQRSPQMHSPPSVATVSPASQALSRPVSVSRSPVTNTSMPMSPPTRVVPRHQPPSPTKDSRASSMSSMSSTGKSIPPRSLSSKPTFDRNVFRSLAATDKKDKSYWAKAGTEKGKMREVTTQVSTTGIIKTDDVGLLNRSPVETRQQEQQEQVEKEGEQPSLVCDKAEGMSAGAPLSVKPIRVAEQVPSAGAMERGSEPSPLTPSPARPAQISSEVLCEMSSTTAALANQSKPEQAKSPVGLTFKSPTIAIAPAPMLDDSSIAPDICHLEEPSLESQDEMEVDELIDDDDNGPGEAVINGDYKGKGQPINETLHQEEISVPVPFAMGESESAQVSQQPRSTEKLASALESLILSDVELLPKLKAICLDRSPLDFLNEWKKNRKRSFASVGQTNRPALLPPLTTQDYQPMPPYQIIAAIGGESLAGSYAVEFVLGEEQVKLAKRWADRRESPERVLPCICISLSCHPIPDDMPQPEEETTLASITELFTKETRWPEGGHLQIFVEADESPAIGIHASPEFLQRCEPIDLTSTIGRRNKIVFHQSRAHTEFIFFLRAHKPTVAQMRFLDEMTPNTDAWNALFKISTPAGWEKGLFSATS